MAEATKTKRTRTMGTILVERLHDGGWTAKQGGEELPPFESTTKAEKWIADNGIDGVTYRITREVLVVTVKTETVRKATLQPRATP